MDVIVNWFPVILLLSGFIFAAFACRKNRTFIENSLRWVLFFSVGIQGIWAWWGQAFYSSEVATSIGWANSPFLFEVACANLGYGIAGLFVFRFGREYWLSLIIVVSTFLWGAAFVHVKHMLLSQSFAISNVSPILYVDIFLPVILWILIAQHYCRICKEECKIESCLCLWKTLKTSAKAP